MRNKALAIGGGLGMAIFVAVGLMTNTGQFVPPSNGPTGGAGGGGGGLASVTTGTGLTGNGTSGSPLSVAVTPTTCTGGNVVSALDGSVAGTCVSVVDSLAAGTGVGVSGSSGNVTVSANLAGASCAAGTSMTALSAGGTGTCSSNVSSVVAGTGISANTASGAATVNVNLTTTSCSAGQAETATAANGTSTCSAFVNTAGNGESITGSTVTAVAAPNKMITVGASGIAVDTSTAQVGQTPMFDGTNPGWVSPLYLYSANDCWYDDLRISSGTTSTVLQEAAATSAGTLAYSCGSNKHPGCAKCTTVAGATNGCVFRTSIQAYSLDDTDITTVKVGPSDIDTLDNGTETVVQELGAGSSNTPTQGTGFGFEYTKTTTTNGCTGNANWQIWVAKNGSRSCVPLDGTNGTVASLVAVGDMGALTGVRTSYMISGTTSRLDFCIGNTDKDHYCHIANALYSGQPQSTGWVGCAAASGCALAATNIPVSGVSASTAQWGVLWLHQKLAGTAVSIAGHLDGAGVCRNFSNPRP